MLTAREAILSALCRACGEDIATRFTRSEICVLAFQFAPEKFAMRGYPHLLDAKRIDCEIIQMCQTRTCHWKWQEQLLVRVGVNLYRLTQAGRDVGRRIEASRKEEAA